GGSVEELGDVDRPVSVPLGGPSASSRRAHAGHRCRWSVSRADSSGVSRPSRSRSSWWASRQASGTDIASPPFGKPAGGGGQRRRRARAVSPVERTVSVLCPGPRRRARRIPGGGVGGWAPAQPFTVKDRLWTSLRPDLG